jgi:fructuronate reductase
VELILVSVGSGNMRLSTNTLTSLRSDVTRFNYDRASQAVGIVHFGIGAFHRAHQAWYTDLAMDAGEKNWMITGVSLRSADVAAQMNPQEGLYSLIERSASGVKARVVGSVRDVLVASQSPQRVVEVIAAPTTRIVSFTITEKGYCRAADGSLDFNLAGPSSVYRFIAEGLRARKNAGLSGLTLLCCDNLAHNGQQLERLMREYIQRNDPSLLTWFEKECTCPSTMVDRIVPATTDADRKLAEQAIGMSDEAAVMTEPFSQWVIEDRFAGPRPSWQKYGATMSSDVAAYETAKLRMLNGAHSALAYLGLKHKHTFVHEAVADPEIRPLVERLMREEAASTIAVTQGQNLRAYADELFARFANPALQHRLIQIAMDGSQKIPQRWLATLAHHQKQSRQCTAILTAIAAWLRHIRGDNGKVDDPQAEFLTSLWKGQGVVDVANKLFGSSGHFASVWVASEEDLKFVSRV